MFNCERHKSDRIYYFKFVFLITFLLLLGSERWTFVPVSERYPLNLKTRQFTCNKKYQYYLLDWMDSKYKNDLSQYFIIIWLLSFASDHMGCFIEITFYSQLVFQTIYFYAKLPSWAPTNVFSNLQLYKLVAKMSFSLDITSQKYGSVKKIKLN